MQQPGTRTGEEITIGVIGADEIVHRVMAVARESGNRSWRLIAAVYNDERDAHRQAMKVASLGVTPEQLSLYHIFDHDLARDIEEGRVHLDTQTVTIQRLA